MISNPSKEGVSKRFIRSSSGMIWGMINEMKTAVESTVGKIISKSSNEWWDTNLRWVKWVISRIIPIGEGIRNIIDK